MIPRILHFIWFGKRPGYVDFSINNFHEVNPDFEINFVGDGKLHDYDHLMRDIDAVGGKYKRTIEDGATRGRKPIQILSNIIRLELLNTYGGIYLDCDCFPIRPFDDCILRENFVVTRLYARNFFRRDCFFIGKSPDTDDITFYMDFKAREIKLCDTFNQTDIGFLKRKMMFKKCRLEMAAQPGYIEHFNIQAWKR